MTQFNYVRAWQEMAKPAFENLPSDIHKLVQRVFVEGAELQQKPDLTMSWPEGSDLRKEFGCYASEDLAKASHIVNCYGHWAPGLRKQLHLDDIGYQNALNRASALQNVGTHWKFSHYCDQVLRDRCDLPRDMEGAGVGYLIMQGFLRICVSTPYSWTWTEVGLGTERTLAAARKLMDVRPLPVGGRMAWDAFADDAEADVKDVKKLLLPREEKIAMFFDTARFME